MSTVTANSTPTQLDVPASLAMAAVHALLFIAAFPPLNLWPLIALAPVPLVLLAVNARTTRLALLSTFVVHMLLWLWMSRWLVQVTPAGFVPYAMVMAGKGVLLVWVLRRAGRHRILSRLPMTLIVPIIWTGWEFLRGQVLLNGYPWYLAAHPIVELPVLAQSADLLGTYAVSFLVTMVSGAILDVLVLLNSKRASVLRAGAVVATMLVIGANVAYGMWRMNQQSLLTDGPKLLVIQTNLPQNNKMRATAEEYWHHFQQFVAQTQAAYEAAVDAGHEIDLIIWPETMVQGFGLEPDVLEFFREHNYWPGFRFAMNIEVLAEQLQTPLLVGSPSYEGVGWTDEQLTWQAHYNSAYLIDRHGMDGALPDDALGQIEHPRYDKLFLTPFGETMPYISNWPWLEQKLLAVGAQGMEFNLDHGEQMRVLPLQWRDTTIDLATPICFEATMANVCRRLAYAEGEKQADVMVNLTNDGWFGFYAAGRAQHAQNSRFRAIENRLPLIRAANTGLSMSIDSRGRVVETIGEGRYGASHREGSLITTVQRDARQTLYGRIGDVWGWMCLLLFAATLATTFGFTKDRADG